MLGWLMVNLVLTALRVFLALMALARKCELGAVDDGILAGLFMLLLRLFFGSYLQQLP